MMDWNNLSRRIHGGRVLFGHLPVLNILMGSAERDLFQQISSEPYQSASHQSWYYTELLTVRDRIKIDLWAVELRPP